MARMMFSGVSGTDSGIERLPRSRFVILVPPV
jgi:hypothetical protein